MIQTQTQEIIHADCLEHMRSMSDNCIDFIITDPPFGISFMGKDWDKQIPSIEYWQEMLRICKPGAMMAVCGLPRILHRIMCIIEDAGWEIRDLIMYLHGQGFPKSLDVSKAIDKAKGEERERNVVANPRSKLHGDRPWMNDSNHLLESNIAISELAKTFQGYGTALKPAYEGWILAMKPIDKTFANNAEKWGIAGLNIDESRIGSEKRINASAANKDKTKWRMNNTEAEKECTGRWPANLILDEAAAEMLDQQTDNASRFFYCPKASSSERNKGLEDMPLKIGGGMCSTVSGDTRSGHITKQQNNHPTVKPLAIMRYIIKLLAPPGNPILLDPFAGSGSTILAAKELGIRAVGIEKESEYCEIAKKKIA